MSATTIALRKSAAEILASLQRQHRPEGVEVVGADREINTLIAYGLAERLADGNVRATAEGMAN